MSITRKPTRVLLIQNIFRGKQAALRRVSGAAFICGAGWLDARPATESGAEPRPHLLCLKSWKPDCTGRREASSHTCMTTTEVERYARGMSAEMPCPIHPSQRWKVCLTKTGPPRCSLARWVLICRCSKEVVRRSDPPSAGKPVRFRPPVQEIKEGKK